MQIVKVGNYEVGQGHPLMLMAGPCVLEGYERSLMIGQRTKAICDKLGIPYVLRLLLIRLTVPLMLPSADPALKRA